MSGVHNLVEISSFPESKLWDKITASTGKNLKVRVDTCTTYLFYVVKIQLYLPNLILMAKTCHHSYSR